MIEQDPEEYEVKYKCITAFTSLYSYTGPLPLHQATQFCKVIDITKNTNNFKHILNTF